MRTSSKAARTCFDIPHSFKSPPLAFNCRRQESKAPSPELSTKRSRLRSSTSFVLASSTGAMSRLNSPRCRHPVPPPDGRDGDVAYFVNSDFHRVSLVLRYDLRIFTRAMQFLPRSSR